MDDVEILALLQSRDEQGFSEIRSKYGKSLSAVAGRHLQSAEDIEETVNDVLLETWNRIPPAEPRNLFSWLSSLTSRMAVNRWHSEHAAKRGGTASPTPLDELAALLPDKTDVTAHVEQRLLTETLNRFLGTLKPEARVIMIQRYTRGKSIRAIAEAYGISESKVKITLMRTRKKLRKFLEEEGWL